MIFGYGMLLGGRPARLPRQTQQAASGTLAFRTGPFAIDDSPVEQGSTAQPRTAET